MITFTRAASTYDPATDYTTGSATTITGNAIAVRGDPQRYRDAGLALATMPTLFFTPTLYDLRAYTTDFVQPGDTVPWGSKTYTVKDVLPIAPDGFVIAARIIIGA